MSWMLLQKYFCHICASPNFEPMQFIGCGHCICFSCAKKLSNGSINFSYKNFSQLEQPGFKCKCPECGNSRRFCIADKHLQREIEQYKINCKYCSISIEVSDIDKHLNMSCEHFTKSCEYCGNRCAIKNMNEHFESCSKFPLECSKCSVIYVREDEALHELYHTQQIQCAKCCKQVSLIDIFAHCKSHSEPEKGCLLKAIKWNIKFEEEKEPTRKRKLEDSEHDWFEFLEQTGEKQPELSYNDIKKMWKQ
jgi:hypothetical protein